MNKKEIIEEDIVSDSASTRTSSMTKDSLRSIETVGEGTPQGVLIVQGKTVLLQSGILGPNGFYRLNTNF